MIEEVIPTIPELDGRNFWHREIQYSPAQLREKRTHIYVLTDQAERVSQEFAEQTDGVLSNIDSLSDDQVGSSAFYIHFTRAELALPHLRRIVKYNGLFAPPPIFHKVPFSHVSAKFIDTWNEAGRRLGHEPFLGMELHSQIAQAVELTKGLPGDFVEIGVFSGSSAMTALTHMRNIGTRRRCWLLDTFEGFQYQASATSADMIWHSTHIMSKMPTIERIEGILEQTGQDIRVCPCEIVQDDLPSEITQVALANIDVDLYEAVLAALNKLAPLMVHRGIMIVEDPTSLPGLYGAYLALDEFMGSDLGKSFIAVRTTTQYFVIRVQ